MKTKYPFFVSVLTLLVSACGGTSHMSETGSTLDVPETQMAIVQIGTGEDSFHYQSIPVLEPGPGEVLVKVVAAAVNPIERRIRVGGGRPPGGPGGGAPASAEPQQSVPGGDLSGIVVRLGEGVTNLELGDKVFSKVQLNSGALNGSYLEYAVTAANHTNLKPEDQTFAEAAGLGTVGVTALRTVWHAEVEEGDRVFINGIGGGIGSSAAQFAIERGAYVLGTASARHHDYLYSIGVGEAINYREVQFDEVITEPVDVVIETVSTETANQALNILRPGGRLVSIAGAADSARCEAEGFECSRIGGEFGWSNEVMMAAIAQLAGDGHYRLNVDATFPLEEAAAAQDLNFNVGTTGKIVLLVDQELANQY